MVSDTTYFAMTMVAWFCIAVMLGVWSAEIQSIWRERPAVVWDYDLQRWRSARLVMRERDHRPTPIGGMSCIRRD